MAITGSGIDVNVDGVTYTFSPLLFEDLEWLELKLRGRAIEAGRLSIPEGTPPAEASAMMSQIITEANKIDLFKSIEEVLTPTGVSWLLLRLVQRRHPDVTLEIVSDWCRRAEVMNQIMPQIALLTGRAKKNAAPPTMPEPLAKGKRRTKKKRKRA